MRVGRRSEERRLGAVWFTLFGLNGILLVVSLIPVLRGAEDRYLHQHVRLFLSVLAGMLILIQRLEIVRADRWLRIAIVVTLGLQVVFAWR
jgi:hypothetical protein